MKQYIMGLITGASLLACIVIFMGGLNNNGKFIIAETDYSNTSLLNTHTGEVYVPKVGKEVQVDGERNQVWGLWLQIDKDNVYFKTY